jgi:hypothetical protein
MWDMNVDMGGLPAATTRTQPQEKPQENRQEAVPQAAVPGTTAALPVAEAALRRVLASKGSDRASEDPAATALDLLRSVEALLRASAPIGTSTEDVGAAAARLVERQGLLARLAATPAQPAAPTAALMTADLWHGTAPDGVGPSTLDTRL